MPDEHAPLGEALGASRAHVVLLLRLDDRRAEHARVDPDVEDREGEPREDERLEPAERGLREGRVAERRHPREDGRVMQAVLRQQVDLQGPHGKQFDAKSIVLCANRGPSDFAIASASF